MPSPPNAYCRELERPNQHRPETSEPPFYHHHRPPRVLVSSHAAPADVHPVLPQYTIHYRLGRCFLLIRPSPFVVAFHIHIACCIGFPRWFPPPEKRRRSRGDDWVITSVKELTMSYNIPLYFPNRLKTSAIDFMDYGLVYLLWRGVVVIESQPLHRKTRQRHPRDVSCNRVACSKFGENRIALYHEVRRESFVTAGLWR